MRPSGQVSAFMNQNPRKVAAFVSECLAFLSRREALTPIGAVEVLGDFDLAAGPHV